MDLPSPPNTHTKLIKFRLIFFKEHHKMGKERSFHSRPVDFKL